MLFLRAGIQAGTGFVVARGMHPSVRHFAVTNWHVACRDGYSVIRLKKRDGVVYIMDLGPHDWTFIPGKYDVAAAPLTLDPMVHLARVIHATTFEPKPIHGPHKSPYMGVGDDAFMLGLFV